MEAEQPHGFQAQNLAVRDNCRRLRRLCRDVRERAQPGHDAFARARAQYERARDTHKRAKAAHDDSRRVLVAQARGLLEAGRGQYELALTKERERIAGELQVGSVRFFLGLAMRLQAIAGRSSPKTSDDLQGCIDDLDLAIAELRGYVFGLDPNLGYGGETNSPLEKPV